MGWLLGTVQLVGDPGVRPENAGEIVYLILVRDRLSICREELENVAGEEVVWTSLFEILPHRPNPPGQEAETDWRDIRKAKKV